ncbi:MAG: biopolymer transporter ExbD [Anaerolineae bacterium]|nr:biopolymer transporter ExbD [Gemmatimonadaceae bacterium]
MASLFHKAKQRRAERSSATASGSINLVPLVDILTSIVFFSLLTYTGAALAALTAFDLSLPPVMVTQADLGNLAEKDVLKLLLAVRINSDGLQVEHSEGLNQRIPGMDEKALDQLESVMKQVATQFPQNKDVLVVPSDEVSYDDVVRVFERLKVAGYSRLALGNRARDAQAAPAGVRR